MFLKTCQHLKYAARRSITIGKPCSRDVSRIPLSEAIKIKDTPQNNAKELVFGRETRITTLPNGLRVCTEPYYGDFATIGVAIESGLRNENGFPAGTARMVEKLAFSTSANFTSRDDIYEVLEKNAGIIDCQSTRDTFMYAASCHRNGVDSIVNILADSVWKPRFSKEDCAMALSTIDNENADLPNKIEAIDLLTTDFIHQAAFQHNTLGYPKFGPVGFLNITEADVYSYMSRLHSPERMVIGGIGVDHDDFVRSVEKYFDISKCTWNESPEVLRKKVPELDMSIAQYTGGEIRKEADLKQMTIGTPYPLLGHAVIGFESCGFRDDDFVPFCVLQSLLGGGGAFSAGGPGKGMYARMYTEVMNKHHWVYSAIAHNHSYADTGLFTISASCDPSALSHAVIVCLDQFLRLPHGTDKQELERAKTQLKSHLMMNLEVRPVLFEDMVRQLLGHNERKQPEEYAEKISKVTNNDIIRVAERLLSSKPSLVGYGDLKSHLKYKDVDDAVAKRSLKSLL